MDWKKKKEESLKPDIPVFWASLVTQLVKNPLAMQETPIWFLGWEDPLEEEMATHSSILVWKIPRTEEVSYSPWGHKESDTTDWLRTQENEVLWSYSNGSAANICDQKYCTRYQMNREGKRVGQVKEREDLLPLSSKVSQLLHIWQILCLPFSFLFFSPSSTIKGINNIPI